MSVRLKISGVVCVVAAAAFAASPALADFNGTLQGDYGDSTASHSSGNVNDWNVSGAGEFGLGWNGLKAQVDAGYTGFSGSGESANQWNVNGDLFWLGAFGRVGAGVGYTTLDVGHGGGNVNATNYGGFVEWFAAPWATLGIKGGGLSLNANSGGVGGNGTSDYVGGEAVVYPLHDVAVSGTYDYLTLGGGHEGTWGIGAEWLVVHSFPVSVWGAYQGTDFSDGGGHTPTINTWMVGLKLYVNGNGAQTLEDRQRSGVVGWASGVSPILNF
jgi:hypothetical protein